jgi:hypothetical protein
LGAEVEEEIVPRTIGIEDVGCAEADAAEMAEALPLPKGKFSEWAWFR